MQEIVHAHTDKSVKTQARTHIMQIAVPPPSVIIKVCGGYNTGMLSSVKSCGQS